MTTQNISKTMSNEIRFILFSLTDYKRNPYPINTNETCHLITRAVGAKAPGIKGRDCGLSNPLTGSVAVNADFAPVTVAAASVNVPVQVALPLENPVQLIAVNTIVALTVVEPEGVVYTLYVNDCA